MDNKKINPFYYNYVFRELDITRITIKWWEYPLLWFRTTYVQISDGYAWYFKTDGTGRVFLIKYEKLKIK